MKNYSKLIDLKNIFLKKINKLNIHFQQYGGANFNDEIEKYKRYNDNLEIINKQIYLLLTIKYIEYLVEFIKSLDGRIVDDINTISLTISKLPDSNGKLKKLKEIIVSFIGNSDNIGLYKQKHIANINSDKYDILSGLDKQKIGNMIGENNITTLENELQIYSQHNNQLFDIITNNETKIKNLINGNSEKNIIIIGNIETKFIFLLNIIEYILKEVYKLKQTNPSLFGKYKNYNIFNYCNTYRYNESRSVYDKIDEICKLCKSINDIDLNKTNQRINTSRLGNDTSNSKPVTGKITEIKKDAPKQGGK